MTRFRLTLGQVFLLTITGLAALLGVLFYLVFESSGRSILMSAEQRRSDAAAHVVEDVLGYLRQAEKPLLDVEQQIQHGACRADDPDAVEADLFREVLTNPNLAEVTLTHAVRLGYDENLQIRLAPADRWQMSVFRTSGEPMERIVTHYTHRDAGGFVVEARDRPADGGLLDVPLARLPSHAVPDPTEHLTFQTTALARFRDETVWSDLHPSEMDEHLPQAQQRTVVTAMRAVEDRQQRFVGVLRVALLRERLEQNVRDFKVDERVADDPHRVLLCDQNGRLVTRLTPEQGMEWFDDDYRVVPEGLPPEIAAALAHPALKQVAPGQKTIQQSGEVTVGGRRYLLTFRGLGQTQGWRVGIVVPEDHYLGPLRASRDRLLRWASLVMAAILLGGIVTVRIIQRGLGRIVATTARMRGFDFAPAEHRSSVTEIHEVMVGLELAKTALRAMGKYVPIDLVRLLYATGREPVLGGELARVSLLFSDIKDFTSLSERLTPNQLALVLGRYLEVMTAAIHGRQGTIDKYIGDAIMAVWNVPTPCPGHARKACEAALACVEAAESLFASEEWRGRPHLVTRFGLHTDEVMVGHFGAPDRMSFTSLGDGVNLAARLEGLNKQYGTTILASEAIHDEAKEVFAFRLVDVVAVKGKTKGVKVYELLGVAGRALPEAAVRYGEALDAYFHRDFDTALRLLEAQDGDGPSRALAERCRRLIEDPPPPDWNGVYLSHEK
jgi:adenylate cyclase